MKVGIEAGEVSKASVTRERVINKGVSVIDFILRIVACFGTLGSAIAMGTARQTFPFSTRFIRFKAVYSDLPMFSFFVIANAVVCGYLALSLPFSILHIITRAAVKSRIVLATFDTAMMALLTAGASAAAAIASLAHNGNPSTNWFAICRQYRNFCERVSGSLIGSFVGITIFMLLIILALVAISRR
ncbi:casparian strip membrane protein 1 [Ziziphus jujuba]|uniref:CASP-like protein n=2 Tax=Ziziphus jujuba TaxID=326968 RepID=A0A6P4AE19_ZIZJJ|nr:casparian strip membrane protein 1 [Ziziphus jujuba]XP_060669340.1 casparian strip membrane protein 1 [Ziziphus jujuba]KAH7515972.1 hypothetical protein FEM48_Zijuj10G0084900 [Ziziphus jujuba var. spinosa]